MTLLVEAWPYILAALGVLGVLAKIGASLVTIANAVKRPGGESVLAVATEARDLARALAATVEDHQDRLLGVEINTGALREKLVVLEERHKALACQVQIPRVKEARQ